MASYNDILGLRCSCYTVRDWEMVIDCLVSEVYPNNPSDMRAAYGPYSEPFTLVGNPKRNSQNKSSNWPSDQRGMPPCGSQGAGSRPPTLALTPRSNQPTIGRSREEEAFKHDSGLEFDASPRCRKPDRSGHDGRTTGWTHLPRSQSVAPKAVQCEPKTHHTDGEAHSDTPKRNPKAG